MLGTVAVWTQSGQNGAVVAAREMVLGAIVEIGYLFHSWQSNESIAN